MSIVAPLTTKQIQNTKQNLKNQNQISLNTPLATKNSNNVNTLSGVTNSTIGARELFNNQNIDDVTINYTSDSSTITIDSASAWINAAGEDLKMLDSINGVPITKIGDNAFASYKNGYITAQSLTLPSGLTDIGSLAFNGCEGITSITLPSGLTSIGGNAFGTWNLNTIHYPEEETTGSGMTTKTWKAGSTTWLARSFWDSNNQLIGRMIEKEDTAYTPVGGLAYGDIDLSASSLTSIGYFTECVGLTSISFPNSITSIGIRAFQSTRLKAVDLSGCSKLLKIESYAFDTCHNLICITLPEGLLNIGDGAFNSCTSLEKIAIPNSVTSIGDFCNQCTSLTDITFGSGLTSISSYSFYESSTFTRIDLSRCSDSSIVHDDWGTIFSGHTDDNTLWTIPYTKNQTDFSNWRIAIRVVADRYPQRIGFTTDVSNWATGDNLSGDIDLELSDDGDVSSSLTIANGKDIKGSNLYFSDTGDITAIADGAFEGNTNLTGSFSISPDMFIDGIGANAFSGCTKIDTFRSVGTLSDPPSNWANGCFNGLDADFMVLASSDLEVRAKWYDAICGWTGKTSPNLCQDVVAQYYAEGVTSGTFRLKWNDNVASSYTFSQGSDVIANNLSFTSEEINAIGDGVFQNNTNITGSVTLPGNITSVGADTFRGCTGLTSVSFAEGLTSIGDGAFCNDSELSGTLTIPTTVSDIWIDAFGDCTKISTVDLSNFTSIPTGWADGCFGGLCSDFLIPPSTVATTRGEWYAAIDNWTNVTSPSVNFQDSAMNYASGVTNGTFDLKVNDNVGTLSLVDGTDLVATDLVINSNSGITNIDDGAFQNDKNLSGSVNIPTDITTIGANVFNGCSNVNEIRLNWTDLSSINALSINQDWLGDLNNSNTTILVPDGMVDAYQAVASSWGMDQCNITDGVVPPGPSPTPTDSTLNLGIALGVSLGICIGIPGIIGLGFLIDYKSKEKKQNKQE